MDAIHVREFTRVFHAIRPFRPLNVTKRYFSDTRDKKTWNWETWKKIGYFVLKKIVVFVD